MTENCDAVCPIICQCLCHARTGCLHFGPCCDGQCSACGKYFESGLIDHAMACGGQPRWSELGRRYRALEEYRLRHSGKSP
jgi:hypothetical protein